MRILWSVLAVIAAAAVAVALWVAVEAPGSESEVLREGVGIQEPEQSMQPGQDARSPTEEPADEPTGGPSGGPSAETSPEPPGGAEEPTEAAPIDAREGAGSGSGTGTVPVPVQQPQGGGDDDWDDDGEDGWDGWDDDGDDWDDDGED